MHEETGLDAYIIKEDIVMKTLPQSEITYTVITILKNRTDLKIHSHSKRHREKISATVWEVLM